MEDIKGTNSCVCEGREFAHLEKFCQSDACFVCKDGRWELDNKLFVL